MMALPDGVTLPNIRLFRNLYRRTLWDWVGSLFRERHPLEPCRIYHRWRYIHHCPEHEYRQCSDCMERCCVVPSRCRAGRRELLNTAWLEYRELEFRVTYGIGSVTFY